MSKRSDGGTRGRNGGQFGGGCGGVEAGLEVAGLECFFGGAIECMKLQSELETGAGEGKEFDICSVCLEVGREDAVEILRWPKRVVWSLPREDLRNLFSISVPLHLSSSIDEFEGTFSQHCFRQSQTQEAGLWISSLHSSALRSRDVHTCLVEF